MSPDHIGAIVLAVVSVAMIAWGVRHDLATRRASRDDAMRRHPSARTPDFTSERARKYHESNQLGR